MKTILVSLLILFSAPLLAQTPSWQWASSAGRYTSHDYCYSIAVDVQGNSYITGKFQDTIDFGSITLGNPGTYNQCMMIAKYDASGNVVWANTPSGNNASVGNSICTDKIGNLYVTGSYRGTITFGSTTFTTSGTDNFFIVKYDTSGNVIWARNAICHSAHLGRSVYAGSDGSVFVTGIYEDSSITFGSMVLPSLPAIVNTNIFLVKYDDSGNVLWANCAGASLQTSSNAVTVDNHGNSYITGAFRNPITFGATTLTGYSGSFGVFTVKYDPLGNVSWAKSSGGFPSSGYGKGISIDAIGNCYITGYFNSAVIIFGTDTLPNAGANDLFIVKYDSAGNLRWSKRAGGPDFDEGLSICSDVSGNIYTTGFFKSSIILGSTSLYGPGQNVFVTKCDSVGSYLWAVGANGNLNEVANGLALDGNDNIYVGGTFTSATSVFGSILLTNSDPFTGSYDLFVARLGITTGMPERSFAGSSLQVFPNPFSTRAFLEFENSGKENFRLMIFNAQGQLVRMMNNLQSSPVTVERKGLTSGMYFFRLISDHGSSASGKLLIE